MAKFDKPKAKPRRQAGLSADDKKLMKKYKSLGAERLAQMFRCTVAQARKVIGSAK